MLQQKISRIQQQIENQNLSGLLLGNYGFTSADDLLYYLLLRTPEYAVCFVPAKGKPTLYTISFEAAELRHVLPEMTVKPMTKSISELVVIHVTERTRVGLRHKTTPIEVFNGLKKYRTQGGKILADPNQSWPLNCRKNNVVCGMLAR